MPDRAADTSSQGLQSIEYHAAVVLHSTCRPSVKYRPDS